MKRKNENTHGRGPTFEPGDDRSTGREEYGQGQRIARSIARLNAFAAQGNAAAEAAQELLAFERTCQVFGCPELFAPMVKTAKALAQTSAFPVGYFLRLMAERLSQGVVPAHVLKVFEATARRFPRLEGSAESEARRIIEGDPVLSRIASCAHRYPPGSKTCERCGLELT